MAFSGSDIDRQPMQQQRNRKYKLQIILTLISSIFSNHAAAAMVRSGGHASRPQHHC